MPKSNARKKLVESEMLEQAAELFALRGFSGTSLQEIADVMKVSRPALYHYIGSKEDLLTGLVRGITQETADNLTEIRHSDELSPGAKLHQAVATTSARIADNSARFRLLLLSEAQLPPDLIAEQRAARHEVLGHFIAIVRDGIDAGVFRAVDEEIAAFCILGACNWVAWWRHVRPELPPDQLGAIIADIAVGGLELDHPKPRSRRDALRSVRETLDYLERALD